MIESTLLANGVTLLLDRVPGTAVACVGYWFRIGSRDEAVGEEGFAHFLEHMLFKGTSKRSARQIALEVDRVGGFLNAFTEKEVTCYHCTVPGESLELAVDVLSDMIRNPLLDPVEIAKEAKVIVSEIGAAEEVAEDVAHDLYIDGLFGGHPVARRITGTQKQVRGVTEARLRGFYDRRYGRATLLVGIAGDITMERARELVEDALDGWVAPGELPERTPIPVGKCWSFRRGRSEQLHFYTGVAASGGAGLKDYYVSLVFSTLIGESMSSRLFQTLREEHALCYSVLSYRTQLTDAHLWTIYASTTPSVGGEFLGRLSDELGRLRTTPPTTTEVADAKSHLRGSLILAQEDMETRMKRMVRQALMAGRALEYTESLAELARVTVDDVMGAVVDRITADRFNLLVYGDRGLGRLRRFRFGF